MIVSKYKGPRDNLAQPSELCRRQCQVIALAAAVSAAALPVATQAQIQETKGLRIEAKGFDDGSGHAVAKLFRPGQNVRQHGYLEVKADIRDGKAILTFPAIPPGDYAVVVFHDSNDNGEIDHRLIVFPKEQLGFSGAFKMTMTSGLPTFDKLKFTRGPSDQLIVIRMEGL